MRETESHWDVETDIHLDEAAGVLVAFPYPMTGVTGDMKIFDDHIDIQSAHMKKGAADLDISRACELGNGSPAVQIPGRIANDDDGVATRAKKSSRTTCRSTTHY